MQSFICYPDFHFALLSSAHSEGQSDQFCPAQTGNKTPDSARPGAISQARHIVLDGGRVVGRIMPHPQGPPGRPWLPAITTVEMTPSVDNRGYPATRAEATAGLKARWEGSHAIER